MRAREETHSKQQTANTKLKLIYCFLPAGQRAQRLGANSRVARHSFTERARVRALQFNRFTSERRPSSRSSLSASAAIERRCWESDRAMTFKPSARLLARVGRWRFDRARASLATLWTPIGGGRRGIKRRSAKEFSPPRGTANSSGILPFEAVSFASSHSMAASDSGRASGRARANHLRLGRERRWPASGRISTRS